MTDELSSSYVQIALNGRVATALSRRNLRGGRSRGKDCDPGQLALGFDIDSVVGATAGATSSPSSSGPGSLPFTEETGVQSPQGTPLPFFYGELTERIRARLVPDPDHPGCTIFPQKPGRHARINFGGKLYSPHRGIAEHAAGRLCTMIASGRPIVVQPTESLCTL